MKIPLTIHPFFWVFSALIGWLNSNGSLPIAALWVLVIFYSVLIHEWGHALTAVAFRQKAAIQLVAMGGLTTFQGPPLAFWKQFLITLNGPLFGFGLYLIATFVLHTWTLSPVFYDLVLMTQMANLFWTIVNLLPVLPLDGGQLLRIVLEANFGLKGLRASMLLGAIFASLLSFYFFIGQNLFIGAFFFLFAFQSFEMWRKAKYMSRVDRQPELQQLLMRAEEALAEGKTEEAKQLFAEVQSKGAGGVFAISAAQYLAFFHMKEGKHQEAYDLLLPLKEKLAEQSLCMLHQLAAEYGNDALVAELSAECYQIAPSLEMALRNARAFARLGQAKLAGGWLQTAKAEGGLDIHAIAQEKAFDRVRSDPLFLQFVEPHRHE
jgi:Zn-dependent protease